MKEMDTLDRVMVVLIAAGFSFMSYVFGTIHTANQIKALKNPPCPTCGK